MRTYKLRILKRCGDKESPGKFFEENQEIEIQDKERVEDMLDRKIAYLLEIRNK